MGMSMPMGKKPKRETFLTRLVTIRCRCGRTKRAVTQGSLMCAPTFWCEDCRPAGIVPAEILTGRENSPFLRDQKFV